jgi:hypothetical protein
MRRSTGDKLGRYEINGLIGKREVYRAAPEPVRRHKIILARI